MKYQFLLFMLMFLSSESRADFEKVDPASVVNTVVLEKIKSLSKQHHSDSLIILRDRKLVYEFHSQAPTELYDLKSATKSILALAIGFLIEEGKVKSIDDPVSKYLTEWKGQSQKSKVTIRDLLGHTSEINAGKLGGEIDISPNLVKLALEASLVNEPGKAFFYNNKAVNLLPEIIRRVSGQNIAVFLEKRLFHPLGIKKVRWQKDLSGNYAGHGGLEMAALDLAKIGQTLLDGGKWKGKQVIPQRWIQAISTPASSLNPTCGLLWWLVPEKHQSVWSPNVLGIYRKVAFRKDLLNILEKLNGATIDWRDPESRKKLGPHETEIMDEIEDRHLEGLDQIPSQTVGYFANGWLGQILLVLPKQRLIIVRQSRSEAMPIIGDSLRLAR